MFVDVFFRYIRQTDVFPSRRSRGRWLSHCFSDSPLVRSGVLGLAIGVRGPGPGARGPELMPEALVLGPHGTGPLISD